MEKENYKKLYNDALERAREFTEYSASTDPAAEKINDAIKSIFPQLAESEDEKARKWIYDYIRNCPNESFEFYGGIGKKAVLAYLAKQKEQKPKWSEEDEHRRNDAIYFLETAKQHYADTSELDATIFWLKSIQNRGNSLKSNTNSPKQEWSEEDENKREGIIQWLRKHQKVYNPKYDSLSIESIDSLINWFKSLRSKPHWKPSEEQMKALEYASHGWKELEINVLPNKALQSLYNDLMKNYEN